MKKSEYLIPGNSRVPKRREIMKISSDIIDETEKST